MTDDVGARGADFRPEEALAADWLRDLLRAVKMARMYRADNPLVVEARERVSATLAAHLDRFGEWTFRITPTEILLGEQPVVRPEKRAKDDGARPSALEQFPFLLYRDGVREITFVPGIPTAEVESLLDALRVASTARPGDDDLVTALWQANPTHLRLETVPLEQTLFVSSGRDATGEAARGQGLNFGLAPRTAEIRAELGGPGGPAGLHRESGFEAWLDQMLARALAGAATGGAGTMDVAAQHAALRSTAEVDSAALHARWDRERAQGALDVALVLLPRIARASHDPSAREALARYAVSGVGLAMELAAWGDACRALSLVRVLDRDGTLAGDALAAIVIEKTDDALGDSLDEAEPDQQGRFLAFAVELGPAGVPLALAALAGAQRSRTRAALTTALCYLCSETPEALEPGLASPHAEVARAVVSVLGQIGGKEVAPLIALAAQHASPVVRREAAAALPALPDAERTPLLVALLTKADPQVLPAALRVARIEKNPRVARALLDLAQGDVLENRGDDAIGALFAALGDAADDTLVPPLETMLTHGGWFARASWRRSGAARALARFGTPAANAALERGLKHAAEPVRAACRDARERRAA
jgi:hypothetical protein